MTKAMTAAQLGITKEERRALVKVRDSLANGKFRHVKQDHFYSAKNTGEKVFNLGVVLNTKATCGTVGCIGGWAGLAMGMTPRRTKGWMEKISRSEFHGVRPKSPLYDLFYPDLNEVREMDRVTPKQAAKAINRFLKTGTGW